MGIANVKRFCKYRFCLPHEDSFITQLYGRTSLVPYIDARAFISFTTGVDSREAFVY